MVIPEVNNQLLHCLTNIGKWLDERINLTCKCRKKKIHEEAAYIIQIKLENCAVIQKPMLQNDTVVSTIKSLVITVYKNDFLVNI